MGPHENLHSILRSPYPSEADKANAKWLMRAWSRSQRSRDNLKKVIGEQNVALDKRNAHIATLEQRVAQLEAAMPAMEKDDERSRRDELYRSR